MATNKEVGNLKSSSGTINHIVKAIEGKILGKNEELSKSPSSFINILLDEIGSINAANFYESLAIKQEAVKSTAKLRRSLVRNLDSNEFKGILGTPALFQFNLGFKTDDLINHSVSDGNNLYRLTVNKDSVVALVDKPVFTFDYDIDIFTRAIDQPDGEKDYTFFAKYKHDADSVHGTILNPFIKGFMHYIDNEKYFILNLALKQYQRNYNNFESLNSSSNKYEFPIPYSNNLYAFEVLYKENDSNEYRTLHGEPDGVLCKDGYNFSLVDKITGTKTLMIKFSRNPDYFSPVNGSSMKIITYTTHGELGNFTINGWDDDIPPVRGINFAQDIDDPYQRPITSIEPLITIANRESNGGSNEMDIDDLRNFVIRKSDSKLITLVELKELVKDYGLRLTKERFDLIDIYYRLSGYIKDEDLILDSTSGLVELDFSKLPYSETTQTNILSPNTRISFSNNKYNLKYNKNSENDINDIKNYLSVFNNLDFDLTKREFFFPYFMRIDLSSYVDAKVYDMAVDDSRPMIFEYYNETSPSEVSIDSCRIYRNPMEEIINEPDEIDEPSTYEGRYTISSNIQINEFIYDLIDNPESDLGFDPLVVYIKIDGENGSFIINSSNITIEKMDDSNHIIKITAILDTDCGIDEYDRIVIKESLLEFPRKDINYDTYYLDNMVDISIAVSFLGTDGKRSTSYNNLLSPTDRLNGFSGISAVYTLKDVELVKNITDIIKPIIDIRVKQGEFEVYDTDVQDQYEETVFETDVNGDIIYEEVTLPDDSTHSVPKILHQRLDLKYDEEGNPIYKHRAGDPITDEEGNYVYKDDKSEITYVEARDFPLIDRIYSELGSYWSTIKAFKSLVDKVNSFQNLCPSGTSGKLGVLNTIGSSNNYCFINRNSGDEILIDRLALSFHIGVKLDDNDINEEVIIPSIKSEIVSFIQNNSTSTYISFMEMLNTVKESISGIKYFELYKVNNYPEGVCHSIYTKDKNTNFDIITVKNIADLSDNNITFVPDIKITII